jgi:hypothetical protein
LGFDVRIDLPAAPVFFQYKLPELMTRNSAFEIVGGQCPRLTTDFFRITLMRRDWSDQHKHLIAWEGRYPGLVFYATPCLPTCAAFKAYVSCGVAQNATLFSPAEIGPLPDDKVHTIAYRPGLPVGYFCSEPKLISAQNIDGLAGRIAESFREKRFHDLRQTATEVREAVLEAAAPASRKQPEKWRRGCASGYGRGRSGADQRGREISTRTCSVRIDGALRSPAPRRRRGGRCRDRRLRLSGRRSTTGQARRCGRWSGSQRSRRRGSARRAGPGWWSFRSSMYPCECGRRDRRASAPGKSRGASSARRSARRGAQSAPTPGGRTDAQPRCVAAAQPGGGTR